MEEKVCKYCTKKETNNYIELSNIHSDTNKPSTLQVVKYENSYALQCMLNGEIAEANINYCPVCGREL